MYRVSEDSSSSISEISVVSSLNFLNSGLRLIYILDGVDMRGIQLENMKQYQYYMHRCLNKVWRTGWVATRWWISKESYDQNLYSG